MRIFTQFDADLPSPGLDCSQVNEGEPVSRTKQAFKADCDVNTIVKRFVSTGEFPYVDPREQQFGDVTGLEFREMWDTVNAARAAFEALPANVRERFAHDPTKFVDFVSDEANKEELVQLGLAVRPSVEDPKAKVVTVGDMERIFAAKPVSESAEPGAKS